MPEKKKILIVDDEKVMRTIVEKTLSPVYRTVCAASGQEALELYESERPDLILLDVLMPEMSGYEVLGHLNKQYEDLPPVIFLTADTDSESESKGFENGARDYIRKPVRSDVLLKRLELVLRTSELGRRVLTDRMTGLLNRASTQDAIEKLCYHGEIGSFVMFDIDAFKLVNDLYSHEMGDNLLIEFGQILQHEVRRSSDVIGRIGGDEFLLFCRQNNDAFRIRQKVDSLDRQLCRVAKELMGEECNIPIGLSAGVALFPEDGTDFQTLYQKADHALLQVKRHGKHGCGFASDTPLGEYVQEEKESSHLSNLKKVYEERNILPGAYEPGKENFAAVYRFLRRYVKNYEKNALVMLVRPVLDYEEDLSKESEERLNEILVKSLRSSDVMTEPARGQFIVLMPNMGMKECKFISERIKERCLEDPLLGKMELLVEIEDLI